MLFCTRRSHNNYPAQWLIMTGLSRQKRINVTFYFILERLGEVVKNINLRNSISSRMTVYNTCK